MTADELMALANDYASAHAAWVMAMDDEEDTKEAEADKIHAALRSALEQVVADSGRLKILCSSAEWDGYAYWLPDLCVKESGFGHAEFTPEPTLEELREAIDDGFARKASNANT